MSKNGIKVLLALVSSVTVLAGCGGGGGGNGSTSTPSGFDFSSQNLSTETSSDTMVSLDGLAYSDNGIDITDPDVYLDSDGNAIITMVGRLPGANATLFTGADDSWAVYMSYYNKSTNKLQRPVQITGTGATYDVDPEEDADGVLSTRPGSAVVAFRKTSSSSDAANGDATVVWCADRASLTGSNVTGSVFYTTFDRSAFLAAPSTAGSGWTTTATEVGNTFTDDNADANDDEDDVLEDGVLAFAAVSDSTSGRSEYFGTNLDAGKSDTSSFGFNIGCNRDNDDVHVAHTYTNFLGLVIVQQDTLQDAGSAAVNKVRGTVWSGSAFGTVSTIAIPEDTTLSSTGDGPSAYTDGFMLTYRGLCFFDFTDGNDDDTADEADQHLSVIGGGTTSLSFAATATRLSGASADNSGFTVDIVDFGTIIGPEDGMNNVLGFFSRDPDTATADDSDLFWFAVNSDTGAQVGATTAVTDASGVTGGDITSINGGGVSKDGDYAVVLFVQEDNVAAATDNDQGAFLVDVPDTALGTAPTVGAAQRLDHNPTPADANGDINISGLELMKNSVNCYERYTAGSQSKSTVFAGSYLFNDADSAANSTAEDTQARFWRYTTGSVSGSTQAVVTGLDLNVTTVGGVALTDVNQVQVVDAMSSGTKFVSYIRQEDGTTTAPDAFANNLLSARLFDSASSTSSVGSAVALGSGTGFNVTTVEVDLSNTTTTKHFVTYLEDRDSSNSSTAVEDDTDVVRHRHLSLSATFAAAAFTPNPSATSSNRLNIDIGSSSSTLTTTMVDANQSYVLMFQQAGRLYYSLNPNTTLVSISQVTNPNAGTLTGLSGGSVNPLVSTLRGGDGTFLLISTQTYGTFDRAYIRHVK